MKRLILIIGLLFWLPPSFALDCFAPSPSKQEGDNTFIPITSSKLSVAEQKKVKLLFDNLVGNWRGKAEEFECFGTKNSPRAVKSSYNVDFRVSEFSQGDLEINSTLDDQFKGRLTQEYIKLHSSKRYLRIETNNKAGDVEISMLSSTTVQFFQKVRNKGLVKETVRRFEIHGSHLTVDYEFYTQNVLARKITYRLKK
ncbi:hypothetical protein H0A36_25170 [Endozoicomonas sp. SM1973]|uniref:THAP4-like heme-binding beta-barrel domain-containing protein n=1 Tax=Spartinivicinus marinus TaxID=2994442 RepID=A0A853IJQ6_9GAMM|nr:hypothetical protein [Spartinivicinus marinus]MCX4027795.1 hypothetical protein [Spartinivicinus marinus]NYZ69315.1 hypothetical protein [Spartinivicinus marinus]